MSARAFPARLFVAAALGFVLGVAGLAEPAPSDAAVGIVEYDVGGRGDEPTGLAYGPDGNIWVAQHVGNRIDRVTPDGEVRRFPLAEPGGPNQIVSGPDGALWFTLTRGNRIGRMTVDGEVTTYRIPSKGAAAHGLTRSGVDELWFTEPGAGKVARITLTMRPTGKGEHQRPPKVEITELPAGKGARPTEITTAPDGSVWFADPGTHSIGRIVEGEIVRPPLPTRNGGIAGIAAVPSQNAIGAVEHDADRLATVRLTDPSSATEQGISVDGAETAGPVALAEGPDDALWVTADDANAVIRIGADGSTRSYPIPSPGARPNRIVAGPAGDLWFTERATGKVGRIAPESKPASVSGLSLVVSPASRPAGHEETRSTDLAASALSDSAVLQSSPLRSTPLRSTPLRSTPLRSTPLRSTPLRSTPLRSTALAALPLRSTTWEAVLTGTKYEDIPLQSIQLEDVLQLDPLPGTVEALTLADVQLDTSPLRSTSLAALFLMGIPLDHLPDPDTGSWCVFLAEQPNNCGNGVDPRSTTLLDLELAGNDLAPYYGKQIDLARIDPGAPETTATTVLLADVKLDQTPIGSVASKDVRSLVRCRPRDCPTLADAQAREELAPDATVGALLALLPAGDLERLGLGELLAGIVDGTEVPFEDGPLSAVLDHAVVRKSELLQYSARFTVDCDNVAGLRVDLTLGEGFRPRPGRARIVFDSGEATEIDVPEPERDGATWRFSPPTGAGGAVCAGAAPGSTSTQTLVTEFEPSATLGSYRGTAAASTAADRAAGQEAGQEAGLEATADGTDAVADAGHDAGDNEATAEPIAPDTLYTGHIATPGDVDLYTLPAPAPGSTVQISLSHLPADYDLVVYGPNAAIMSSPLRSTPLRSTPLRSTPVGDESERSAQDDQDNLAPSGLQGVPLRSTPLRSTSLQRGTETESASVPVFESDQGRSFTIQVSGYDGARHDQPYVLRATVKPGPDPLPCRKRTLDGVGRAAEFPSLPLPGDTRTLILLDSERMGDLYGADRAEAVLRRLRAYAARPDVAGVVVPVESDENASVRKATNAWDTDPCSPAKANAVVAEIGKVVDHIRPGLSQLRNIVIVGSDEAVPMGRVPDLVTVANEREYTDAAVGGMDTAVSRALASGMTLTDDPYGDFDPQTWLSGKLYVPDVALGRLVETPEEISAQLDQYQAADGVLAPRSGGVLGYDFLVDGSKAVGAALNAQVPTSIRTDSGWTSKDALAVLNADQPGYVAINAHYNHYQALPAKSFADGQVADLLESSDADPAARSVLFTMGCHAGLNLPDIAVSTPGPGDRARLLDWAQASAGKSALFTGSSGFGYGDTDVVAYSERLMQLYADGLARQEVTAGQALMFAKQRYIGDQGVAGVYDGKVVQQTVFYGLPTYRIGKDGREADAVLPPSSGHRVSASSDVDLRTSAFSSDPATSRVDTGRGSYWRVEGQPPQVTHFHPIQPRVTLDVTADDGLPVHGAVIEAQTSTDLRDVDPVFSRPTIDNSRHEPERPTGVVAFPEKPQSVNTFVAPGGRRDALVLITGQTISDKPGRATQRLFDHLSGTVYRSDSDDWTPPGIGQVEGTYLRGTVTFSVRTPDTDVMRGVVLYRTERNTATWRRAELRQVSDGHWSVGVRHGEIDGRVREFNVQLVDRAGNVAVGSNKGWQFQSKDG